MVKSSNFYIFLQHTLTGIGFPLLWSYKHWCMIFLWLY